MEYKIGDKLEVATKMWYEGVILESKVMTLTRIYDNVAGIYYAFDNNDYIHYPINRIIRKVED